MTLSLAFKNRNGQLLYIFLAFYRLNNELNNRENNLQIINNENNS